MATPHKHAELIKQWADDQDLRVQYKGPNSVMWVLADPPYWSLDLDYRIVKSPEEIAIEALEEIVDCTNISSNSGRISRNALRFIEETKKYG